MNEVWLDLPGYEGTYQVSSFGRVRTLDRYITTSRAVKKIKGRMLYINRGKYRSATIDKKITPVHRLVALAFFGECPEGYVINHKDLNTQNNHVSNLEYVTIGDNRRHGSAVRNGITAFDVEVMRILQEEHGVTAYELSQLYPISEETARRLMLGRFTIGDHNVKVTD